VIVLMLAATPVAAIRYAVMLCTTVTTICGVFSAYGEPPNLIMRANLAPHLGNDFFLYYCGPVAVVAYLVVAWQLRRQLRGRRIDLAAMDVIDANVADVRFLQATRHGEVLTPVELIEGHAAELGPAGPRLLARIRGGESVGIALVHEDVPEPIRRQLLGHFVSEELASALDRHYVLDAVGDHEGAARAARAVDRAVDDLGVRRRNAQRFGGLAIIPFAVMLILHGVEPRVPLFVASFAGFLFALPAIADIPRMRALAWREARTEYAEYYFLFPLFVSISLLTAAGFFDSIAMAVQHGIAALGPSHVALAQFLGSTTLSAILDNNIVADFASRGLPRLELTVLHLFAMAQIAGYALGGCWTHIGSAQSVVAYAFIRRDIDDRYTPVGWIRDITPAIVRMLAAITAVIYLESLVLRWLP
jgi:Na+/H+ antiporter NhaD/arsenite permease-like protein